MKRYFTIFLALVLAFNFTFLSFSYAADTIDNLKDVNIGDDVKINTGVGSGKTSALENAILTMSSIEDKINGIWATILGLPFKIFELLSLPLQAIVLYLPTIDGCIFNTQNFFKLSFFDAKPEGSAASLQGIISSIYNALRYLVTAVYIVTLVYLAIRMMLSSIGRQKAHYKELFKHWIVGLLLLFSFHWVMAFVIWLCNTFVEILRSSTTTILAGTSFPTLATAIGNAFGADLYQKYPITVFVLSRINGSGEINGSMGWIISALSIFTPVISIIFSIILISSSFSIMLTYFKRLFTIAVLILTFPLVALSYVFDKIGDRKAQTLSIWLKEFTVNVMVQPIHALILLFLAILFNAGSKDGLFVNNIVGAIMSLAALRLIPLGEELLKKLFQINSSIGPGSHGIAGSMARAGMAFQGAKNIAGSLGKIGGGALATRRLIKQAGTSYKDAKQKAKEAADRARVRALNKGTSEYEANRRAEEARKASLANNRAYQNFKKELKETTGANSVNGAIAKSLAQVTGATAGVGFAVTGADSGKFLSTAATQAAMGAAIAGAITNAPGAVKNFFMGDATKAEDFNKRADKLSGMTKEQIDKLSKEDKNKIAAELGIKVDLVNGKNKDKLIKAYHDVGVAAKWGAPKEKLKTFTQFYRDSQNLEDGLMPDGSGPIDYKKFSKITQTKEGIMGEFNGELYHLSNRGNSKLEEGKSVSIIPALIGQALTEENLMAALNNPKYNELVGKKASLTDDLSKAESERDMAAETLTTARVRRDELKDKQQSARKALEKAEKALESNPGNEQYEVDLIVAKNEYDEVTTQYKDAEHNYTSATESLDKSKQKVSQVKNEISKTEAEMAKIYKEEYNNQLSVDKAISDMTGSAPQYAETAFEAYAKDPSSGSIKRDSSGVTLSYSYQNDSGTTSTATYTLSNQGGSDTTLDYSTTRKVEEFIGNNYTPPSGTDNIFQTLEYAQDNFATLSNDLKHGRNGVTQADVDKAQIELQSLETQTRNTYASEVSRLSVNPSEVTTLGGNSDILSYFETNGAVQEAMGSSFISSVEPPKDDGFSYGICTDLSELLSKWENSSVNIELFRTSDTKLHYTITNTYTRNIVSEGDIDISNTFNNQSLDTLGSRLTIFHNSKGAWFHE